MDKEIPKTHAASILTPEQVDEDLAANVFICENTDGILDPLEQIKYALNETQVRYGSVIVLKDAP
jgi:hypothetical protein